MDNSLDEITISAKNLRVRALRERKLFCLRKYNVNLSAIFSKKLVKIEENKINPRKTRIILHKVV